MNLTIKNPGSQNKVFKIEGNAKILSVAYMLDKVASGDVSFLSGMIPSGSQLISYVSLSKDGKCHNSLCINRLTDYDGKLNISFDCESFDNIYEELIPSLLFAVSYAYANTGLPVGARVKTYFEKTLNDFKETGIVNKDDVKILTSSIYEILENFDVNHQYSDLEMPMIHYCYNKNYLNVSGNPFLKAPSFT